MAAGCTGDDDLVVRRLILDGTLVLLLLFTAAITAARRNEVPLLAFFVHVNSLTQPGGGDLLSNERLSMPRWFRSIAFGLLVTLIAGLVPARAARPIVDLHKLDAYFALFARDSNVPWKPTTVRLDTYSSAPVDFSVYQVAPADVLVAGANASRPIDTRRIKPVARWRFTPPGGYQFQSSEVPVPLGAREGFFVVEARRGNVGEQVWINRTRVGLLTKETPSGMLLYGADLGSGRALARMRVSFVVNSRFDVRETDAHGLVRWRGNPRPIFAIAEWARSVAFVSFLPQAPLPPTIVGINVGSAVIHAGEDLHVVGFARTRFGSALRSAKGDVQLSLRLRSTVVAQSRVRLDGAGSFNAAMHVPDSAQAGDYAVLAIAGSGTAGSTVHVDADAGGLSLSAAPQCEGACPPTVDVPIIVRAMRAGLPAPNVAVHVAVVRSPHVDFGAPSQAAPWGITRWLDTTVRTDEQGRATVQIPHPTDGLASTYGVRAESAGATADTRVVVATSNIVLHLQLDREEQSVGTPVAFDVNAADAATGKPVPGVSARVQLVHGQSVQEQQVTLDAQGHARGSFSSPAIGSNLIIVKTGADGEDAMDAQQVQVVPQALQQEQLTNSGDVAITLDKPRYIPGEQVHATASLGGASGDVLVTMESAVGTDAAVAPSSGGHASATFKALDAPGALAIGAAFVRDGALRWSSVPLTVDGPGRPGVPVVQLDKRAYQPGEVAVATLGATRAGDGTVIVRLTSGAPSGSALFDATPNLLAVGTTTSQDSAPDQPSWHPWVDSTGKHAQIISFARRGSAPQDLTIADADTRNVYWSVDRHTGDQIRVPVPNARGTYTLSILKFCDDGRVSAASSDLVVQ
ncbi:MAG: hypothetical protein ACXWNL_08365 [Vulcanimicrobiaceae bacterium]